MRIISGKHKGRRLTAPKNLPVRPTTDMAKEALFNILNNRFYLEDIKVLDLFSGTGNISFEFASRGTTNICAVDSHFGCVKFINETSDLLDFNIKVFKSEVIQFLQNQNTEYDVIFADPPYNYEIEQLSGLAELIFKKDLVSDEGLLIIEHSKHLDISSLANYAEEKRYGGSIFSFFKK